MGDRARRPAAATVVAAADLRGPPAVDVEHRVQHPVRVGARARASTSIASRARSRSSCARHHALRAQLRRATARQRFAQRFAAARLDVARLDVEDASLRAHARSLRAAVRPRGRAARRAPRSSARPTRARARARRPSHRRRRPVGAPAARGSRGALSRAPPRRRAGGPTFADYAHWEASDAGRARSAPPSATWWLERFAELPSPLELPADFDRPPRLAFDGDEVVVRAARRDRHAAASSSRGRTASRRSACSSRAYAVVLSRLGNTPDVVDRRAGRGPPPRRHGAHGRHVRQHRAAARAAAPPTSRSRRCACGSAPRPPTRSSARATSSTTSSPTSGSRAIPSRNPLFDVLFAWEEAELAEMHGSALGLVEIPAPHDDVQVRPRADRAEHGARASASRSLFAKKLFRRTTAERFLGNLRKLLEQVARTTGRARRRAPHAAAVGARDAARRSSTDTAVAVPRDATMVELFAAHVRERPDAIARRGRATARTRSPSSIAARRARGGADRARRRRRRRRRARDGRARASCSSRCSACWKAGAGYLPIEPDAPAERVATIVGDSAREAAAHARRRTSACRASSCYAWDAASTSRRARRWRRARAPTASRTSSTRRARPASRRASSSSIATSSTSSRRRARRSASTRPTASCCSRRSRSTPRSSSSASRSSPARALVDADEGRAARPRRVRGVRARRTASRTSTRCRCSSSGFTPKQPLALRRIVVGGDICPVPVAAALGDRRPAVLQRVRPDGDDDHVAAPSRSTRGRLRRPSRIPVGRPVANTQDLHPRLDRQPRAARRARRDVHRRRRRRARLPQQRAADRASASWRTRTSPRRAHVQDRRHRALAARRHDRLPRPRRQPDQDPRLPRSSSARSRPRCCAIPRSPRPR